MAKTSKVKSSAKKKSKKKPKPKASALVQGIGVVSSISLTREMKLAFVDGVADQNVVVKFRQVGSYKRAKLKRKFDRFKTDPEIGLIVTVGGSKSYDVARTVVTTKPFISLVGVEPTNPPTQCYGGLTLNSFAQNGERVDYLVREKSKVRTEIALLHNPNSKMANEELANWAQLNAGPVYPAGRDGTAVDENDSSTFGSAFEGMASSISAVVVSADPFFTDSMDELVDEANRSNKFVCYPLQDYFNAIPRPAQFRATLLGPSLKTSYTTLGQLAKEVLASGTPLDPLFEEAVSDETEL